jgi:hypothetical protein
MDNTMLNGSEPVGGSDRAAHSTRLNQPSIPSPPTTIIVSPQIICNLSFFWVLEDTVIKIGFLRRVSREMSDKFRLADKDREGCLTRERSAFMYASWEWL